MENISIPPAFDIFFIKMIANKALKNHDKKKINLVMKIRGSLFNESHPPAVKEEIL